MEDTFKAQLLKLADETDIEIKKFGYKEYNQNNLIKAVSRLIGCVRAIDDRDTKK